LKPTSRFCPAGHGVFALDAELCLACGERLVVNRAGLVVGEYVCERLIGLGGMSSTVWQGRGLHDSAEVAVKIIEGDLESPEARRLIQSASLMCGVEHPNVARIYAYGETDEGEAFVAMELLRGKSLLAVLQHRGALALKPAIHIARELLTGLDFVHARQIVHRDVKPANLYLSPRGGGAPWEVRLIDFGIAKHSEDRTPDVLDLSDDPASHGSIIGTPEYMAPEQVLGFVADPRADLYAAGVVLYRMIAGELPFRAQNRRALYELHLREAPPLLSSQLGEPILPALADIVSRALSKQPSERFQTASGLVAALDAL
jgi:serine/threonine-protein kinase